MPLDAAEPFLCDGVPWAGLELMTGSAELEYSRDRLNAWSGNFLCSAGAPAPGSESVSVSVSRFDTEGFGHGSPEEQIDEMAASDNAVRIDGDAPVAGLVVATGSQPHATRVCPDWNVTEVRLYNRPEGRETAEDLERYLRSMLPWACGDAEAPQRTVDAPDGTTTEDRSEFGG